MTPIKTGAQIYSAEYQTYHIGDIYQVEGVYICKCHPTDSHEPIRSHLHLRVNRLEELWNMDWHVLICRQHNAEYFGYEGKSLIGVFSDGR